MQATHLAPPLKWFDEWLAQTGEPIPDFDSLPSIPELPDLLRCENGCRITDAADWPHRRRELRTLMQRWVTGTWPDTVPELTGRRILEETHGCGATSRRIELSFAGPRQFSFVIELMIPDGPGPFPVFLTQDNHRRWATLGLSRGYLCCVYPGADSDDQSEQLAGIYQEHDWSKLTRRAWLGCRALDYVLTLPAADPGRVGISGHSRNGKQSLIAAAMDDRIGAVISSSSGSGGVVPWRCSSEFCFQESVEFMTRQSVTRDWFHPRLRLFTGREDRLPIDCHAYLGLIAPRPCLVSDAMTDGCGSLFGVEMSVRAGRPVYELLGAASSLNVFWRWGNHETDAQIIGRYFDWLDTVLGNAEHHFPDAFFFDVASPVSGPAPSTPPPPITTPPEEPLQWLLGETPPGMDDPGGSYGSMPVHRAAMVGLGHVPEQVEHISLNFSEYVRGELFFPAENRSALTPVIWLHPFSHSYGTAGAYMSGPQVFYRLAREGYAVLAFTQLGCGQRSEEGRDFYQRYPNWSKMGKMVRDVRSAVDLLTLNSTPEDVSSISGLPVLDSTHISVIGYSLGGLVGLLAAARDERIAAVASFCGAVPFRHHGIVPSRGAMQRFWQLTDLLPRLTPFAGREQDIPVDLGDVLEAIAPRACLLVAPRFDREIDCAAVKRAVEQSGPYENLTLETPPDYNRFHGDQHDCLLRWLSGIAR